jgi:hypothetical protein
LISSTEYRSDLIDSYDEAYLGQPADGGGISTFLAQFALGATNNEIQASFLASGEFYAESD